MPLYGFAGKRPAVAATAFIHPQATIIGDVDIGEGSYVGAGVVLRGDFGRIIIGKGISVQDNCVIHADIEATALVEDNCLVAHCAIIHGPCVIREWAVVGQGANIVGFNSELGNECILAAGSLLPPGMSIPARKLAMGNPARIVRDVTDKMVNELIVAGVRYYQQLAQRCLSSLTLIDG